MLTRLALVALALVTGQALIVAALAALRPRGNIYATIIVVAISTVPVVIFADRLLFGRALGLDGRIFLALLHLSLGGAFFHFITLPDRSVTLRMLAELEQAPGRMLPLAELTSRYSVRDMIASRLEQLAEARFLEIRPDGSLVLMPRGTRFGRFVTGGRRLFRIASAN